MGVDRLSQTRPIPRLPDGDNNNDNHNHNDDDSSSGPDTIAFMALSFPVN